VICRAKKELLDAGGQARRHSRLDQMSVYNAGKILATSRCLQQNGADPFHFVKCSVDVACSSSRFGSSVERKQQRPNETLVRSPAALHFSLTPGFSRVPAQAEEESRLNGFCSSNPVTTELKSGVNERFLLLPLVVIAWS